MLCHIVEFLPAFIRWFFRSFIPYLSRLFVHSFFCLYACIRSLIFSFTHSLFILVFCSFILLFACLHLFVGSSVHSFILYLEYSFIHSFACMSTHPFHSIARSLIRSIASALVPTFIHSIILSFINPFNRSFLRLRSNLHLTLRYGCAVSVDVWWHSTRKRNFKDNASKWHVTWFNRRSVIEMPFLTHPYSNINHGFHSFLYRFLACPLILTAATASLNAR